VSLGCVCDTCRRKWVGTGSQEHGLQFWNGGVGGSAMQSTYQNWNATQPSGGVGQNCMGYTGSTDGKWE
jgi:hypothetical protein